VSHKLQQLFFLDMNTKLGESRSQFGRGDMQPVASYLDKLR
jgi:hypothetical protein